ncbi:MAG: CPBP family intramembrane metalloprotease [Bacteroidales bacterium]|jgi:membrane protease YdiL (CAAX protease family)|nr:CPBP family intramembrane metalloprotease [Bacteroidales bacterium]
MKNIDRFFWGILLTAIVFLASVFIGGELQINIEFIPKSFWGYTLMLILSIALICGLKKHVNYKISVPKFKKTLKTMLFGFLAALLVNTLMTIIGIIFGIEAESHYVFNVMSPLQIFLFVFICASVAEEVLFRGFLQNILSPMKDKGIKIFKRHISVPVIIAALAFSLVHLNLISTDAGNFFLAKTLVSTFIVGLIAGYYQEKYDNNVYAILVHMGGNFMGVMAALLMNQNLQ